MTTVQCDASAPAHGVILEGFPVTDAPVIAIVDDEPSVRRALQRLLRSAGYTVQAFASGHEFLGSLPGRRPACLVLDIHLGGMNGFDLQAHLAADGVGIPVIFITAHDDAPTRERIERSGAAGHLWKPVDEQELLDAIGRAIASNEGAMDRLDGVK
jgi:FixJ family two-component response regulator